MFIHLHSRGMKPKKTANWLIAGLKPSWYIGWTSTVDPQSQRDAARLIAIGVYIWDATPFQD